MAKRVFTSNGLKMVQVKVKDLNGCCEVCYTCQSYLICVGYLKLKNGELELITISAESCALEGHYPSIIFNKYAMDDIQICNKNYGNLSIKDFEWYLKEQQEALKIADFIKRVFLEEC